jgi:predicted membrane channel-forming protein YqfA (hemolysin III family)
MRITPNVLPHLCGALALSAIGLWLAIAAPSGAQLRAALLFLIGNVCCFLLSFTMHQQATTHGAVSSRLLRLDYLGIVVHIWTSSTSLVYGNASRTRSCPMIIAHAFVAVLVAVVVCCCDFVLRKRPRAALLGAYGGFSLASALFCHGHYGSRLSLSFTLMVGLNSLGGILYLIDLRGRGHRPGSRDMHVLSLVGSLFYTYEIVTSVLDGRADSLRTAIISPRATP